MSLCRNRSSYIARAVHSCFLLSFRIPHTLASSLFYYYTSLQIYAPTHIYTCNGKGTNTLLVNHRINMQIARTPGLIATVGLLRHVHCSGHGCPLRAEVRGQSWPLDPAYKHKTPLDYSMAIHRGHRFNVKCSNKRTLVVASSSTYVQTNSHTNTHNTPHCIQASLSASASVVFFRVRICKFVVTGGDACSCVPVPSRLTCKWTLNVARMDISFAAYDLCMYCMLVSHTYIYACISSCSNLT